MPTSTLDRREVSTADHEQSNEATTDPRQLVLPYVDTAIDLADGRFPMKVTLASAALGLPAVIALAAGLWVAIDGAPILGVGLLAIAVGLALVAVLGRVAATWAVYPHERVLDTIHYCRRRWSLPWGYRDALARAADGPGIEQVITVDVGESDTEERYAGVRTHDGRVVVPLRLRGENTAVLPAGEVARLAGSLTHGLETHLADGTAPLAFHATTRPAASGVVDTYAERARAHWRTRLTDYEAGLLGSVGEWVEARDRDSGANETRHYLFVTADGAGDGGDLSHRLEQAHAAIDAAESVGCEACSPREVVNLVAEYWERRPFPEGAVGESAVRAGLRPVALDDVPEHSPSETPTERVTVPEWYAERPRHVEVGEAVARTYWISSWPVQPEAGFLQALYTLRGVDLDITLYAHPRSRERTISRLKRTIPRIDAEGMDRAERLAVESLTIDDDLSAYILAYKLLQSVHTQPWGLSGYVTVRAPDVERLKQACERVTTTLRSPPANAAPAAAFGDQHDAFRAGSPFGRDHLASAGRRRYRATKTHLALGGVFGAALPDATPEASDRAGVRWGRDGTTGRSLEIDPFAQGTAPHLLTVGPSGSGKTFAVEQATQEWWLAGEDRTVIYCDTQGGFEDVVEAFGAEHLVIDGQTGLNPLEIHPAAAHDRAATDGGYDQYRLKVDEATEFFCGILRSHGVDPAAYHAVIEQAVERTFAEAGIGTDPASHERASPTPADLFEMLERMVQAPETFTFTAEGAEADRLEARVADLLSELSGFKPGGKYHTLLGQTAEGLSPETDIAYIDMRHLAGQTGGTKSVNLQLAVGQVTQLIKQTSGQTIFVIDEAHNLLHSEEMTEWLNKAAREWRRYDAALWFVTQSPQEFVRNAVGTGGEENKRETILEQCSIVQVMHAPRVSAETLGALGLPDAGIEAVRTDLTPGSAGRGYAECLLSAQSERGWIRTRIEASPVHGTSIEFSHRSGDAYVEWMRRALEATDG